MKVRAGRWSLLAWASSTRREVAVAVRVALLSGHIGSWLPHTRLGLRGGGYAREGGTRRWGVMHSSTGMQLKHTQRTQSLSAM